MAKIDVAPAAARWFVLAVVLLAQFMFGVDVFIVNVAIPTIRSELSASSSEAEAIIAVYLIAYATLVISGGRLGDIYGVKNAFIAGVAGFTVASVACGLAQSADELLAARLIQGASAALMAPQVLATINVLFRDETRARAFSIYGIVLGVAGAVGFPLGGYLIALNMWNLGWRSVFLVNVPLGIAAIVAAWLLLPTRPQRVGVRLDLLGSLTAFLGLLCVIGPILFWRELAWPATFVLIFAAGIGLLSAFLRLETWVKRRGGVPLVDPALIEVRSLRNGMGAALMFFFGNLSFYFVTSIHLQSSQGYSPSDAGIAILPVALAFVAGTRVAAGRAAGRGSLVLTEGCALAAMGLGATAIVVICGAILSPQLLLAAMAIFGFGQGVVMASLPNFALRGVPTASSGSASGVYGAAVYIGNAAGIAAIGTFFFVIEARAGAEIAYLAALGSVLVALIGAAALMSKISGTDPAEIPAAPKAAGT
jgi:MFS family permease